MHAGTLLNKKIRLLYLLLFIGDVLAMHADNGRLLLIDTGFNDPYIYKNFLALANSIGFKAEVKSFFQICKNTLDDYGSIIVHLDGFFVGDYIKHKDNLEEATIITQKIISLLSMVCKKKNRLLGFMLPSRMGATLKDSCQNIFELAEPALEVDRATKKSLCSFLQELMQSDSKRSMRYHTTLLTKHEKNEKFVESVAKLKIANAVDETTNTILVGHLPFHTHHSSPPLAWYCANQRTGKKLFITKASLILFSDIGENFIYNPLDFSLRFERLKELQQLLYELYRVCVVGKFSKSSHTPSLAMPQIFSKKYLLAAKKRFKAHRLGFVDKSLYDWIEKEAIWCGWGELDAYTNEKSVKRLIDSKYNLVWLRMTPESYLAKSGLKKKDRKDFYQCISGVTEKLQSLSKGNEIPHFFVGAELTSNFFKAPVKNPAVDCYGHVYTKIPSPFDFENFWKPELLDVIDKLIAQWPTISHGIPLAGFFLDLEMYHAQDQAGQYLTCMDFSDLAWRIFCAVHYNKKCYKLRDTRARVAYLLNNNLVNSYFAALQKKAYEIGYAIKDHIIKKLPKAFIGVYNIHLPHTWFYKGLLAGLSSKERPLILATFNNDFYCHYPWLVKNGIYAYHLPVLLLSKFKKSEDFNLIDELSQLHDGVWFNRISRLEESRDPKDWAWDYAVEVTPLTTDYFVDELRTKIIEMQTSKHNLSH